jgi:hypothetical protein
MVSHSHGEPGTWTDEKLSEFLPQRLGNYAGAGPFGDFQQLKALGHRLYGVFSGNRRGTNMPGGESFIDPVYFEEGTSLQLIPLPGPHPLCGEECRFVFGQKVPMIEGINPPFPPGCPACAPDVPTGSITFRDGEVPLGSVRLAPPSKQVSFTVQSLSVGTHSLFASYSGDAVFSPATSPALSLTIEKAPTTISLHSSPNPSTFGAKVIVSATVAVPPPGAGSPSGTVTFYDNGVSLGTSTLDSSGHASLQVSGLTAGVHSLTASYSGDESFAGSTSAGSPESVTEFANLAFSGSLTDARIGQPITLPGGATFNGSGEFNSATGTGSVDGSLSVPPFTASLKLFGLASVNLGLTLTQVGAIEGTVARSEAVPGDEALSVPVKLSLGVTSLSLLGLKLPTACSSVEPLSFNLTDNLTSEELLHPGWSFTGTTTVPKVRCAGGLLGDLFGDVLTHLLSGAGNPYALTIRAP